MKAGDLIYDKDWKVFARVQKTSNADTLYHTATKFKMIIPKSKNWVLIDEEAIPGLKELLNKESQLTLIKNFLANFPDDAASWGQATDEIIDLARSSREILNLGEEHALNRQSLHSPSEWNTQGKKYILDNYARMNAQQKLKFFNSNKVYWY